MLEKISKKRNNKQGSFKNELLGKYTVTAFGWFVIALTLLIAGFLVVKGTQTFTKFDHSVWEFLFSSTWNPNNIEGQAGGDVGAAIFIVGSLYTCSLALLIATPFAIGTAIFMTEISPKLGKKIIQPAVEIFVGIPSIIYGFLGYILLCKWFAATFPESTPFGLGVLQASIVLAIMIYPTITTVTADAIRNVPDSYRKAGYGLGSTRWQVIYKIVLPSATQGILTGIILGLARAFGEALAVAYVIGRVKAFADTIVSPTYNITAIIASEMADAVRGGEQEAALWSLALLLFLISLFFILLINLIGKLSRRKFK